jgi:hypothetical protein
MRSEATMRDARKRLEKLEAQVNELFAPVPTPEEQAAKQEAWNAMVERWLTRLTESMAPAHHYLLKAWIEDYRQVCQHDPCPLPPRLRRHLDILWGWKRDESKPIALPPAVVACYLNNPRVTGAHGMDCEDCGYPVPVTGFHAELTTHHFPHCPLCGGITGWHAWDIKHGSPGYQNLKPYSQRV